MGYITITRAGLRDRVLSIKDNASEIINYAISETKTLGGTVNISRGEYEIQETINVTDKVSLFFQDCVFIPNGDIEVFRIENAAGNTVDGVATFDGRNTEKSGAVDMFVVAKSKNVSINAQLHFTNSKSRGLGVRQSSDIIFNHVTGDNTHDLVYVYDSEKIKGFCSGTNSLSDTLNIRSSTLCDVEAFAEGNNRNGVLVNSTTNSRIKAIVKNCNGDNKEYHGLGVNQVSGGQKSEYNTFNIIAVDDRDTPQHFTGLKLTSGADNNMYSITGYGFKDSFVLDEGKNNITK